MSFISFRSAITISAFAATLSMVPASAQVMAEGGGQAIAALVRLQRKPRERRRIAVLMPVVMALAAWVAWGWWRGR